jgi:hypothetical protein
VRMPARRPREYCDPREGMVPRDQMGPPGAHEYVRKASDRIKEGDYSRKTWHNQLLWVERPATELDSRRYPHRGVE